MGFISIFQGFDKNIIIKLYFEIKLKKKLFSLDADFHSLFKQCFMNISLKITEVVSPIYIYVTMLGEVW